MIKLLQPPCRALENMQTGPAARKVVDKVLLIRKKHIPVNWPRTVNQLKGKPFYGQAKGKLCLTRRPYAGPSQWPPPIPLRGTPALIRGEHKSLYASL